MTRFPGFLLILLVNTIWVARCTKVSKNNVPFGTKDSKFMPPETDYPDNDGHANPFFQTVDESKYPEINIENYELPDDFYPENDRDAIPIYPEKHPFKTDSRRDDEFIKIPIETKFFGLDKKVTQEPKWFLQNFFFHQPEKVSRKRVVFEKQLSLCLTLLGHSLIELAKALERLE